MTDLIARLELFEQSMARCAIEGHDSPNVPWCDYCTNLRDKRDMLLADNLPTILHALKVQQAAERHKQLCANCRCGIMEVVRAVKGEQP